MTHAEELFHRIAAEIPDTEKSKMFGSLCLKAPNGKAGVLFRKDTMVFKLEEALLKETLQLDDAKIFDPYNGRPMNGWVELPFQQAGKWPELTKNAMDYVKKLPEKGK